MSIDNQFGFTEGITGPMGSGKTSEFILKVKSLITGAEEQGKPYVVVVAKPSIDVRSWDNEASKGNDPRRLVSSRLGAKVDLVVPISSAKDLSQLLTTARTISQEKFGVPRVVIAVSEIQLLDSGVLDIIRKVNKEGTTYQEETSDHDEKFDKLGKITYFLWEGLNNSFRGEPFPLNDYKATMEDVIDSTSSVQIRTRNAICDYPHCMEHAVYTQRYDQVGKPDHWASKLVEIGSKNYGSRCKKHLEVPGKEDVQYLLLPIRKAEYDGYGLPSLFHIGLEAKISLLDTARIIEAFEREQQVALTVTDAEGVLRPLHAHMIRQMVEGTEGSERITTLGEFTCACVAYEQHTGVSLLGCTAYYKGGTNGIYRCN